MSKSASMSAEKTQAPQDSRDVQNENVGTPNLPYWWGHRPIYIQSKSQKVKSKVLAKRNSKR